MAGCDETSPQRRHINQLLRSHNVLTMTEPELHRIICNLQNGLCGLQTERAWNSVVVSTSTIHGYLHRNVAVVAESANDAQSCETSVRRNKTIVHCVELASNIAQGELS
jgi:hypothetical protein